MSKPLGVEERARLRTLAENREQIFPSQVLSLLDALEAAQSEASELTDALRSAESDADREMARAERAEADLAAKDEQIECLVADRKTEHDGRHRAEQNLADEKRRRAAVLKVLDETEWNDWPGRHRLIERLRRALLDTATEGTGTL